MLKKVAVLDDYQGAGLSQPHWERLRGRIELHGFRDTFQTECELVERLRPFEILVAIRERTHFSPSLLRQLPTLELLSLTGRLSGQVDVADATSNGVLVTQTEGGGPSAIEMTMALILAIAHRVPQEDRAIRQGLWQTGVGFDLSGKTLGIVGLGRIGSQIAAFGKQLGMHVLAWSENLTAEKAAAAGATYMPLDDLLRESDIVTLHLRLSERTRGLLTARHIALMNALREDRIRGAALDVFETEPLPVDHPLRSLENVVLAPHMGYVSEQSYDLFFRQAVDNIEAYLDGQVPPGALNPEVLEKRSPSMRKQKG